MFGICNLAIIPLRKEPNDRSEMVSQALFGDHFEILENQKQWLKIKLHFDGYEGWIDSKQIKIINAKQFDLLNETELEFNLDLVAYISDNENSLSLVTIGSTLSFLNVESINLEKLYFDGLKIAGIKSKSAIVETAFLYLNAPYLWGGKTPFGIDCSAFTQMTYKLNGYKLFRDASQQASQGEVLSFIEECEPGDLAFFDNDEGKIIHVGIILEHNYIIHASGKVRIDRLDHSGIYNEERKLHTHRLRLLKRII